MLVYLDTDALSHLISDLGPARVISELASREVCLVAGEQLLEEVLVTGDPDRRERMAGVVRDLLRRGGHVLAAVERQLKWGWVSFDRGGRSFRPYGAYPFDRIQEVLGDARTLPDAFRDDLRAEHVRQVSAWDTMHQRGRVAFQSDLGSGDAPLAAPWVESHLRSDFVVDIVMEATAAQGRDRTRVIEFISWNPLCRAMLELLLLMIRRHGLLHEFASSKKKDPKWADISHGVFAPVVDWFVTDDRRMLRLLREQREAGNCDWTWQAAPLNEFLDATRAAGAPARELDVLPPMH